MSNSRFAIYYLLPPEHQLHTLASHWLGYDIHQGKIIPQAELLPEYLRLHQNQVGAALLYGFHGTLKAPFRLAKHYDVSQLIQELDQFVDEYKAFHCSDLRLTSLGHFLALSPEKTCSAMNRLADDCVKHFDPFRAPLSEQEYQKRKPHQLNLRQRELLGQWGYPYVLGEYRFHMTLSAQLEQKKQDELQSALQDYLAPALKNDFHVDRLYLCCQSAQGKNFEVISEHFLKVKI